MSIIQHKRSSVSGHVPSSLSLGELAVNEADLALFYLDNGVVTEKGLIEPRRFISRGEVSNVATLTLDLTPANVGVMLGFDIYLSELRPATNGVTFRIRLGDASGIKSGSSDYRYSDVNDATDEANDIYHGDTGQSGSAITSFAQWSLGSAASDGMLAIINLTTNDTAYAYSTKLHALIAGHAGDDTPSCYHQGGELVAVISLTQIQFSFSSGNIANCKYAVIGVP